jgi:hypothetical protein
MAEEKPQWIETMLNLYSEGRGDIEVCKELKITRTQFNQYCADVPAFAELVERGRDYAEAWWMEQGRINLKNKEFVPAIWQWNMINRYNWSSKKDSAADRDPHLNVDKLRDELFQKMPELARTLNWNPSTQVIDLDESRKAVVKASGKK